MNDYVITDDDINWWVDWYTGTDYCKTAPFNVMGWQMWSFCKPLKWDFICRVGSNFCRMPLLTPTMTHTGLSCCQPSSLIASHQVFHGKSLTYFVAFCSRHHFWHATQNCIAPYVNHILHRLAISTASGSQIMRSQIQSILQKNNR